MFVDGRTDLCDGDNGVFVAFGKQCWCCVVDFVVNGAVDSRTVYERISVWWCRSFDRSCLSRRDI